MTSSKGGRVLLVEDDPTIRGALARILTMVGYEVEGAPDGAVALEHLAAHPCDVVVTDFAMPHTNGLELLQAVRRSKRALPVIMLSGSPTMFPEARRLGAFRCLEKPMSLLPCSDAAGIAPVTPAAP